jgi:hypothetical protein
MVASVVAAACTGNNPPTAPTAATLTAPTPVSPNDGEQLATLRPTLTVQNGTSNQSGPRVYEFQVSDRTDFAASSSPGAGGYVVAMTRTGIAEGTDGRTVFTLDQDLQPTTRFYWRVRMSQGSTTSDWSAARQFNSKLVGFLRAGELYDPLIHGETAGDRVGSVEFIAEKGVRINDTRSYIRYLLPQTIDVGEFSMDVEGLRANAPGDKTKVFGMQEGQDDFITNRYRVDAQYRGTTGFPPNAIQWRAMFGSEDEKLEPSTATRMASVFLLDPSRTYHWKGTWDHRGFRLQVMEGGVSGTTFYDQAVTDDRVDYLPRPHYAYLGAPTGRSGNESASIPGAIYRNVWLANRSRPASLGSALR